MIAESGHYALVLALGLALIQSIVPLIGARLRDDALMNVARSTALAQLLFVGASFIAPCDAARGVGLLRRQRLREFPLHEAAALQDHWRVGKP
ncbi:hypothetical protein ACVWXL_001944 [Bradyrhizobium sp. GM22.5]